MRMQAFERAASSAAAPGFGLGLAALGRPSYLTIGHGADVGGHPDRTVLRDRAHEVLDAAWQRGVRYFDAARSYGLAEAFLGGWLRERAIASSDVAVGSKWGYRYTADWQPDAQVQEVKEHSRAMFDQQRAETAATIGTHLGLYQIHSATLESGVLDDHEVLAGLRNLARTGVAIGLSTSGPGQAATIERALTLADDEGGLLFDAVQATWNLLEPSAGAALDAAAAAGLVVIVKEALANGRLTDREPRQAKRLKALVPDAKPDAIALAAALQQPWSKIVLSGAATVEQLESNLEALEIATDLTDAGSGLVEDPARYWEHRSTLAWT